MLLLLPLILNSAGVIALDSVLRIVGGEPVSILERPFQITLLRVLSRGVEADCGGTILNKRWILTAAHCLEAAKPTDIVIRAGSDDLNAETGSTYFKVEKIIRHKGYSGPIIIFHDIALLKTAEEIVFAPNIKPINLRTAPPEPLAEAIVSGYGVTKEGGPQGSPILKQVSVRVIGRNNCLHLIEHEAPGSIVSNTHFCAADLEGGNDACQGDSGGPITIDGSLAGVVSWGVGCGRRNVPAFYTDVSQYISWIDSIINK